MPASKKMPSQTFASVSFARIRKAEAARALAAGEYQRQPGGAVFEIVQRLRIGLRRVRMVDPLHDLPRRARRRPAIGLAPLARAIDRLDLQAVIGLADQLLERRALQHAVDQLAPVLVGRRREIRRQPQFVSCRHPPGRFLIPVVLGRKLPRCNGQAKRCFGARFGQPRSGSRSIPSVESAASASRTLRPAMRRSGAISASGTSTKARSNRRGCGSVSSGLSSETSS